MPSSQLREAVRHLFWKIPRTDDKGQTILEFAISTSLVAALLLGCAGLFRDQWVRVRCAHEVFEATHEARRGSVSNRSRLSYGIKITDTGVSIRGESRCGRSRETVELPKLEAARWR
ncbi:MAG TPA: hypothetical protein VJB59_01005 [Bdellovibrionota bacterium]|nr:hypothetical protein [Bdellovibrionota bacterium]